MTNSGHLFMIYHNGTFFQTFLVNHTGVCQKMFKRVNACHNNKKMKIVLLMRIQHFIKPYYRTATPFSTHLGLFLGG